jgi:hypothetical protein
LLTRAGARAPRPQGSVAPPVTEHVDGCGRSSRRGRLASALSAATWMRRAPAHCATNAISSRASTSLVRRGWAARAVEKCGELEG